MEHLIQHGLSNAAAAAVLAVLAAIATRLWRNPHFAYALWLIVLLRLVAPPLFPVGVPLPAWTMLPQQDASQREVPLPSGGRSAVLGRSPLDDGTGKNAAEPERFSSGATISDLSTHNGRIAPDVRGAQPRGSGDPSDADRGIGKNTAEPKRFRSGTTIPDTPVDNVINKSMTQPRESFVVNRLSLAQWLAAVWIAGTFCYLLLVGVRAARFSRALRAGRRDVPEFVHSEAAAVAAMAGLRRSPGLAMIAAPLPPLVWPGWRPTVLLPQALVESLSVSQRRLLLLHEFVHIRRLDHRVRWFQLGVVALSWWNPIAWWAARRLERAEEDCCDAAVLQFHPDESQGYGQTLLAVTEFLATGKLPAPALAIGIVRKHHLKRRLTMILDGPRWPRLSKTQLAIFCLAGALMMTVTWRAVTAQNDSRTARAALERRIEQTSPKHSGAPQIELAEQPGARLSALLKLEPLKPEPGDDELQKLLKERYNAALSAFQGYQLQLQYELKANIVASVCTATRDLFEAELALVSSSRDKTRILERSAEVSKNTWKLVDAKTKQGLEGGSSANEGLAHAATLEAEIKLLRFRAAERSGASDNEPVPGPPTTSAWAPALGHSSGELPPTAKPAPAGLQAPEQLRGPTEPAPPDVYPMKPVSVPIFLNLRYAERIEPAPNDDQVRKLLKEKYNATARAMQDYQMQYQSGNLSLAAHIEDVLAAGRNLRDAQLALAEKPQDQLNALEPYLAFTEYLERTADEWLKVGSIAGVDASLEAGRMHVARVDAEVKLLQLRRTLAQNQTQNNPGEMPPTAEPSPAQLKRKSVDHNQLPAISAKAEGTSPSAEPEPTVQTTTARKLPALLTSKPAEPAAGDDPRRTLLKERFNAALRSLKASFNRHEIDPSVPFTGAIVAARQLLGADVALQKPAEVARAYERYLELAKFLEQQAEAGFRSVGVGRDELEAAHEARLDAEIKLLDAKRATR